MHTVNVPLWAIKRGKSLNDFPLIEPLNTALVVVDLQNAFVIKGQPISNPHALGIVPLVNSLATKLRSAGGTVVWTRHTFTDLPPLALPAWQIIKGSRVWASLAAMTVGTFSHALHANLDVLPQDLIIDKYRYSAFIHNSSDLDLKLRAKGIDTLIITGTVTNCCCESTARDGNMLGYKILFTSDATAALTDEEHNAALLNISTLFGQICTASEVEALIEAGSLRTNG